MEIETMNIGAIKQLKAAIQGEKWYRQKLQIILEEINANKKFEPWKKSVLLRDDFLCQRCFGRKGKKIAHRLADPFTSPQLAFDVENGVCLCENCENDYIDKYGIKKTTKRQFENFVKDYYPKI
jgi:hypothetical protein